MAAVERVPRVPALPNAPGGADVAPAILSPVLLARGQYHRRQYGCIGPSAYVPIAPLILPAWFLRLGERGGNVGRTELFLISAARFLAVLPRCFDLPAFCAVDPRFDRSRTAGCDGSRENRKSSVRPAFLTSATLHFPSCRRRIMATWYSRTSPTVRRAARMRRCRSCRRTATTE
jgi:hypothetical protein